ncbi:antitoxin Xre/MbcA/ParS toxin-binding domain-containing protein [Halomonas sp. I5-271120]|uniref:antitoxin Xre/MbcA/ParS toxin-binding domain-containing protein n=1 Tax=Halomonas sp. I5-271120 TaxID=3061632 RepID=UPI00271493F5|nr:antitoxin Xre/MbcA/ParS toxin-binding domain-containing protein [Halomonas sp. I5-271120]
MTTERNTPRVRLRGSVIKYEAPLEPAAEAEDWTIYGAAEPVGEIAIAVWRAAIELFEGNRAAAERWLYSEVKGLGWKRPIDVMREDPHQVLDLIGRLERGVHT